MSHDKGRTFETTMSTLTDHLGYKVQYKIINSHRWVPQARQRVYIVGFSYSNDFNLNNIMVIRGKFGPVLGDILHPQDGSEAPESPYTIGSLSEVN